MIKASDLTRVQLIRPLWPAPDNIVAGVTTRYVNTPASPRNEAGDFASDFGDFNLAMHVGDDPRVVQSNRNSLKNQLEQIAMQVIGGSELEKALEWRWLNQVHGDHARKFESVTSDTTAADAILSDQNCQVCAVLTADCLPILLSTHSGDAVAAIHAGWRGLANGVVAATIKAMTDNGASASKLYAWLGPAIGPGAFEVGSEVVDAFQQSRQFEGAKPQTIQQAFAPSSRSGHFFADIYQLAAIALRLCGVHGIYGGGFCTYKGNEFYSYRRQAKTGRMASFVFKSH